jgi:WD40 repeat protein
VGSAGLDAPSNASAAASSETQINLSWKDNSSKETGFEVQRSTTGDPGTFAPLTALGANIQTYRDQGLVPLTRYCYQVRAVRMRATSATYSAFSNTACETTGIGASVTAASVIVLPESASVVVGGSARYRAEVRDSSGALVGAEVTWATSNPAVAAVSATSQATPANIFSEIQGVARGRATITASSGGKSDSGQFSVVTPLRVTTSTTGVDLDPSGYTLSIDGSAGGGPTSSLGLNDTISYGLEPGNHMIGLAGVAPNCSISGEHPRQVNINPDQDALVGFEVLCAVAEKIAYVGPVWCYRGSACDGSSWSYSVLSVAYTDGSEPVQYTDAAADPAWSPDGRLIAVAGAGGDVFVLNTASALLTALTQHPARDWAPAWSPDGGRIAFASERDGRAELYLMNADGSSPVRVTDGAGFTGSPAWSPDGSRILFDCTIESGNADICAVNVDGSGLERLISEPAQDRHPAWSPDGRKIAFDTERYATGTSEIAILNLDGTGVYRIAPGIAGEAPAWSPDGSRIAFTGWEPCDNGFFFDCPFISLINSDGSGLLVGAIPLAGDPAWRPRTP